MLIYEPKGRAREYSPLACNLYKGCDHACKYCYVPGIPPYKFAPNAREAFAHPATRNGDFLASLEREAKRRWKAGDGGQVLLSFTCDPYQSFDVEAQVTRRVIQVLHATGHTVCTLTKGGSRALRDLDLFGRGDAFATTLTWMDDADSLEWEPGAALPGDRLYTIHAFHEAGIETWASLEPVLDPDASLQAIRETHTFVDLFKVGKFNHHPLAARIDWRQFVVDAVELLESLNHSYYLKDDLAAFLPANIECPHRLTQAQVEARSRRAKPETQVMFPGF